MRAVAMQTLKGSMAREGILPSSGPGTSSRAGGFQARFFHKVLEREFASVKGHFGPINTIAITPDGRSYASGGEEGYIRLHHFDPEYFVRGYE